MRDKEDIVAFVISLVIAIGVVAVVLTISHLAFEAIANSNMPDWLKWLLLRG